MSDGFAPPPPPAGDSSNFAVPSGEGPGGFGGGSGGGAKGLSRNALIAIIAVVAVLIGVGFYVAVTGGDDNTSKSDASSSPSTVVADPTSIAPSTESTVSPGSIATTSVTPTTTLAPRLWDPSWSWASVPELTVSGIRGSGCGSGAGADVSIGDTYPDGVWFGQLGSYDDTDHPAGAYGPLNRWYADYLEIDGFCVYTGALGQQKWDESDCATGEYECMSSPTFWMENNNERFRRVPVSPNVLYEAATNSYLTDCTSTDRFGLNAAWRFNPVWIVVQNGMVTEVHADCYFTP